MSAFVGIDGGGSGSRWAVLSERGLEVGEFPFGPALQLRAHGVEKTRAAILACWDAIPVPVDAVIHVVVGVAGAGDERRRADLAEGLQLGRARVSIVTDVTTAAASALPEEPGVAVFAGTGSFAVARDDDGRLHRAGGRGSLVSDHGGAYRVVLAAVEAALRTRDGVDDPTSLLGLAEEFTVEDVLELPAVLESLSVADVAARFPAVVGASQRDEAARRAVKAGAAALAALCRAVADRASLRKSVCRVVSGGGALSSDIYRQELRSALRTEGFIVAGAERAEMPPEAGAAWLARAVHEDRAPLAQWVRVGHA